MVMRPSKIYINDYPGLYALLSFLYCLAYEQYRSGTGNVAPRSVIIWQVKSYSISCEVHTAKYSHRSFEVYGPNEIRSVPKTKFRIFFELKEQLVNNSSIT